MIENFVIEEDQVYQYILGMEEINPEIFSQLCTRVDQD